MGPPDWSSWPGLEHRVQAALAEGARARQHAWVTEQGGAHRAGEFLLQEVHDESPESAEGSGTTVSSKWKTWNLNAIKQLSSIRREMKLTFSFKVQLISYQNK